jgi:hypothetical protein
MTTFTVTTAADVVDAGDGVLSPREAVQPGHRAAADPRHRRPATLAGDPERVNRSTLPH